MADTVKTLSDLQTLLADNTAGDISAQDLRDFLVTALEMQADMGAVQMGGRLTLVTGSAVADSTGSSTVYYTPYLHGVIGLWDTTTSKWVSREFSETSLALGTVIADTPYDVFGYWNSGTLALEKVAWTDDTTRATAVTVQNGRRCKSGDPTKLYLGSFYTISTSQTCDQTDKRFLYNEYNRVYRIIETTGDYSGTTYTQNTSGYYVFNGDSTNAKFQVMCGSDTALSFFTVNCYFSDSDVTSTITGQASFKFNGTTSFETGAVSAAAKPMIDDILIYSNAASKLLLPANRKSDCYLMIRLIGNNTDGNYTFSYAALKGGVTI